MYLSKNERSPYYQIIYEIDGKRTSKSTGKKLKSEALQFLTEFEKQLEKTKETKPVKLSEFINEYLQFISIKSESYQRSVKLSFKHFTDFIGKDLPLRKIDIRIVEKFLHITHNRSESLAALFHRTLKAAFSKAYTWQYIRTNPFKAVKPLRTNKSFPVFINESELNKIIDVTKEDFLKVLFMTAFYTGMRLGEIVNLKMNAIDFDKRIIIVRNTETFTTKNRKERIIPINDILFSALIKYKFKLFRINDSMNEYVFYRIKGVKLANDYVSKKFKKSVLKAGLNPSIHFHSLRHSTASLLAQRGVSLLVIKELLGHSTLRVTEMYSHLQRSDLENAIKYLGEAI